jgi:hypothetical protein
VGNQEEKVRVEVSDAIFAPEFLRVVNQEMKGHTLYEVGATKPALAVYGEDFSAEQRDLNIELEPARGTHGIKSGHGKTYETNGVAVHKLDMFAFYETPETLDRFFTVVSAAEAAAHEKTNGAFRATPGVRQEDIVHPKGAFSGRLFASDWVQNTTHKDGVFPPPSPVKALTFDEDMEARNPDGRMVRVKKGDFLVIPDEGPATSLPAGTQWSKLPFGKEHTTKESRLKEAERFVSMSTYALKELGVQPAQKPVVSKPLER